MWTDGRNCSLLVRWRHSLQFEVCRRVPGRVLGSFGRIDVGRLCQKMPLGSGLMPRDFAEKFEDLYHRRLGTYCWEERRCRDNLGNTVLRCPTRVDRTFRMERRWCPGSKPLGKARKSPPHTCQPRLLFKPRRQGRVVKAAAP